MARWHGLVTTLLRLLRKEDLNLDLYSSALYYVLMISDTPPFSCYQTLVHFRREEGERTTISLRVLRISSGSPASQAPIGCRFELVGKLRSKIVNNGYAKYSLSVENFPILLSGIPSRRATTSYSLKDVSDRINLSRSSLSYIG